MRGRYRIEANSGRFCLNMATLDKYGRLKAGVVDELRRRIALGHDNIERNQAQIAMWAIQLAENEHLLKTATNIFGIVEREYDKRTSDNEEVLRQSMVNEVRAKAAGYPAFQSFVAQQHAPEHGVPGGQTFYVPGQGPKDSPK